MPYALITGASKGIGKAFAEQLAEQHHDVLLVSRSADLLDKLCNELTTKYQVKAAFLPLDLSEEHAADKIADWLGKHHLDIDILINNAGYGLWGEFEEQRWQELEAMMRINMITPTQLTHRLIPFLRKNKKAYILNVSSATAYQAMPTLGVYAASKSFVLSFSRSISYELKRSPVSVSVLCPGSVSTDFVQQSRMYHMKEIAEKMSMPPEAVARAGLRGMFAGKKEIIPGLSTKGNAFVNRILPKWIIESTAARIYKKKEGE